MKQACLILIRHGQSVWNEKNLFTGWVNVDLSQKGKQEAHFAGLALKKQGLKIDHAFSSALKRSIQTLELLLVAMDQKIPFEKHWRLNEKHYGDLQGKNKEEIKKKFGAEKLHQWRRSFDIPSPSLEEKQTLEPKELYKDLDRIPKTESLKQTQKRVLFFWSHKIIPLMKQKKCVLISAHGNSLRSLIKELEHLSDKDISDIEIQTGQPIIYKMNESLHLVSKNILPKNV